MVVTVRARLLVEGNVQGVGYRAFVKQVARGLRIKGYARNLEEGAVEIYCEAPSAEVLEAFRQRIDVKGDANNPLALHVASLLVFTEKDKDYQPKADAFKAFRIDFEEKLSPAEQEMIEKTEIGGLLLQGVSRDVQGVSKDIQGVSKDIQGVSRDVQNMGKDIKGMSGDIQGVSKDIRGVSRDIQGVGKTLVQFKNESKASFGKLDQTLTGFKDQTVGNFSTLDTKYGTVSSSLDKINANLEALNHTFRKVAAKILQA